MSYTPTNWKNGDVITSEKLNKIEGGIANADGGTSILFATLDTSTRALDKTWQEIANADVAYVILSAGVSALHMPVVMINADQDNNEYYAVSLGAVKVEDSGVSFEPALFTFKATSADGYPVFQM